MKFSAPSALALAAPLLSTLVGASPLVSTEGASHLERRIQSGAPHFVAYWDAWLSGENGPPATSQLSGFNNLILAFLLATGTADQAQEWTLLDAGTRSSIKSSYAAAGINILVSAFGSTETPTSSGFSASGTASTMAAWVKTYGLDGIDVDYEDFAAINKADGSAENWLITFTQTLRSALPAGQYIITHAPVAPWFSPIYTAGAYTKVHQQVGSLIDWYNIQFYNQGVTEYTTCAGLLTSSSSTFPNSAVFQIASTAGVPLSKIVIGKPGTTADANNGYIDANTLAGCLSQGKNQGWTGGAMVWQFPNVGSSWITTVRSQSWPVGSVISNPTTTAKGPTTTSTAAQHTTTAPSSGSCAGVAAWNSQVAYTGGQEVTYAGKLWKASWWTEADTPGGAAGVWVAVATC